MFVCLFPEFLATLQCLGAPTAPTVIQPLRKHRAVDRAGTLVSASCYQIPPVSLNGCVTQGRSLQVSELPLINL